MLASLRQFAVAVAFSFWALNADVAAAYSGWAEKRAAQVRKWGEGE